MYLYNSYTFHIPQESVSLIHPTLVLPLNAHTLLSIGSLSAGQFFVLLPQTPANFSAQWSHTE